MEPERNEFIGAQRLYRISTRAGLALAERQGRRKLRRMDRGKSNAIPRLDELEMLFGPSPVESRKVVQERVASCHAKSRLIKEITDRRGLAPILPIVESDPASDALVSALRTESSGVIVTTYHAGPKAGVWAYLYGLGVPLLKLQNHPWSVAPENWSIVRGVSNAAAGMNFLRQARRHLAAGGWIGSAFDDFKTGTRRQVVPCLGQQISLASGVASLSIMTGAPILVISARWSESGRGIRIGVEEPLRPESFPNRSEPEMETALMERLARSLEAFMTQYPWEFTGPQYRRLLREPLADPGAELASG